MKRRTFLLGAAGLAAAGSWWLKPEDRGGPYDPYFASLNAELRAVGPAQPSMLVDIDRLDANIAAVRRLIRSPQGLRVVAKSLPSIGLLRHVLARANTNRVMAFHQPFITAIARDLPDADVLLGKPLPVRAAAAFYAQYSGTAFVPERQLQWLVDTPARLAEYKELAEQLGQRLRINIEIDVGLHRGGVADSDTLAQMLGTIRDAPGALQFAGFMGYDPHVVKMPPLIASREELFAEVMRIYQSHVDLLRRDFPTLDNGNLTFNGAGSPTYPLYPDNPLVNDVAVGSAMVKPADFDIDTLTEHRPACFIATPVLKAQPGIKLPATLAGASDALGWWDPNQQQSFFIYGGYWKAQLENPPGLQLNNLYGRSTNQELVNGSHRVALQVNDHVFLRPTQSEFVFLQFGDLLAVQRGKIIDRWPVLAQS